jgi:beta-ribofuranosylaminobenzene 5'-phosphate synthase
VTEIVVTAPARLHFGMLDPAGAGSRRFGGFGIGVEYPRVVVEASSRAGEGVVVEGEQAGRAAVFAERCWAAFGMRGGGRVFVRETIPPHVGLGSGTKLGLAIARALAELAGAAAGPAELAAAAGRGARSSVGCWTFAAPGLVVEGGVRDENTALSPLIARHAMPAAWRCVLALPPGADGLAGTAEQRAFELLRGAGPRAESVCRLLLTALLPGLVEHDVEEFGAALTQIQREVGSVFAEQQGGIYHPRAAPLIETMLELGVRGVGQSSWGPSVYGIIDGPDRAAAIAQRLRQAAAPGTEVSVVDFDRAGARVQRTGAEVTVP